MIHNGNYCTPSYKAAISCTVLGHYTIIQGYYTKDMYVHRIICNFLGVISFLWQITIYHFDVYTFLYKFYSCLSADSLE